MRKLFVFTLLFCVFIPIVAAQNTLPPEPFAVWSANGQMRAVATPYELQIFDAGETNPVTLTADEYFTAAAFSDSGVLIATWDESQFIRVWNTTTGEMVAERSYVGGSGRVRWIQFANDDQTIAFSYYDRLYYSGGKRNRISLEHEQRKQPLATATPFPDPELSRAYFGLNLWNYLTDDVPDILQLYIAEGVAAISPDFSMYATVSYGSQNRTGFLILTIPIRDLQTGETISFLGGLNYRLRSLEFNPANPNIAVVLSDDGVVRLSNITDKTEILALSLLRHRITSIRYSPNGETLATGGVDGKVRLWNPETGEMIAVYEGQPANVYQLHFTSGGNLLAFGDPLAYPRVWNARTLETVSDFRPQPTPTPTPGLPTLAPPPDFLPTLVPLDQTG